MKKENISERGNWVAPLSVSLMFGNFSTIGENGWFLLAFSIFYAIQALGLSKMKFTAIEWDDQNIQIKVGSELKYSGRFNDYYIVSVGSKVAELNMPNGLEKLRIRKKQVSSDFWGTLNARHLSSRAAQLRSCLTA